MLASDDANREFVNPKDPDSTLEVLFFKRSVPDNFQSENQRKPIFIEEDWLRILIPGRSDLTVEEPVTTAHIQRFPQHWARYTNSDSQAAQGTPLEKWGDVVNPTLVEELKGKRFHTVEQIAYCSDTQAQALGMAGPMLRKKAREFVSQKGATGYAAELKRRDEENDALRKEMADMKAMMQELLQAKKDQTQQGQQRR